MRSVASFVGRNNLSVDHIGIEIFLAMSSCRLAERRLMVDSPFSHLAKPVAEDRPADGLSSPGDQEEQAERIGDQSGEKQEHPSDQQ